VRRFDAELGCLAVARRTVLAVASGVIGLALAWHAALALAELVVEPRTNGKLMEFDLRVRVSR
jgi:Zn-dependent protease